MAAPKTWVAGELVDEGDLNTEIRDRFLKSPAVLATAAAQTVFSTAAENIAMVHGSKYKTADESVNNSTTLQNDDHLAWTVGANEVWAFRAFLPATIASGNPGMKTAFTVPAGSSGYRTQRTNNTASGAATSALDLTTALSDTPTGATNIIVEIAGVFINGATPGTVQLQWAQASAVASNLTLKAGAYIDLKRLA